MTARYVAECREADYRVCGAEAQAVLEVAAPLRCAQMPHMAPSDGGAVRFTGGRLAGWTCRHLTVSSVHTDGAGDGVARGDEPGRVGDVAAEPAAAEPRRHPQRRRCLRRCPPEVRP